MPDDLLRRSHAVLKRAVELDGRARDAYIESACAGDPRLRERVAALVSALTDSRTFLEIPALARIRSGRSGAPNGSSHEPVARPEVPGYRIVGVIGSGGMATVYEAMQENPPRRVALKVMRQGLERTSAVHRFRFETEVLARLQHPGIAQLYEAGAWRDAHGAGHPYFAMEYIDGARPITAWADGHNADLAQRLAMFAAVCDAVQHGHQCGVIHRDLKPSNVLVDAAGRPKVIDFGVARAADPRQAWITRQSNIGELIGTLNYMSPEQCEGSEGVDVRSDVYALGILLYELACGRPAHDLSARPIPEALRAVREDEPSRPSSVAPHVRGDLEAIILKAIDKDPDRRYQTAAALAADLRRFSRHETVEARPPTLLYQCRLFARRNKALVAASISIAAALVAATGVSTVFAVRARAEAARRARAEAAALDERDAARRHAYVANVAGGFLALQTGEYQQLRRRLAQASSEHRGWEWDLLSGLAERSSLTIPAHGEMIYAFAASADGTRLATGARDGTLRLWSAATGERIAEAAEPNSRAVAAAAFSPDGAVLATGGYDGAVRLWDAATAAPLRVLGRHTGRVEAVSFGADGVLVSASSDGACRLWDTRAADGEASLCEIDDQPGGVHGAAFTADGQRLLTWSRRGSVWVRTADAAAALAKFDLGAAVWAAAATPGAEIVAAGGAAGRVTVWSGRTGETLRDLPPDANISTVRALAISPSGDRLAAGQIHRGIAFWSVASGELIGYLRGHEEAVSGLAFSPSGETLYSSSWDRTVRVWELSPETPARTVRTLKGHDGDVLTAAFSPDGSILATGARDGLVMLWDAEFHTPIGPLRGHQGDIYAVSFSPDGRTIASGGDDRKVRLWDAATGAQTAPLEGHTAGVWTVAFDPARPRLASGGSDKTVRIWSLPSRTVLFELTGHAARVIAVRYSPDGSLLASASRDGTVRIWEGDTGRPLHVLTGHQSDVFALEFNSDGSRLYSGSRDQTVRVWDPRAGTSAADPLAGHGQFVTSLALSPDGERLAAGSWFGEVLLWDTRTLELVASFKGSNVAIRSVAFRPDGGVLVTGGHEQIRIFDARSQDARTQRFVRASEEHAAAARIVDPLLQDRSPAEAAAALAADPDLDPAVLAAARKILLRRLQAAEQHPAD